MFHIAAGVCLGIVAAIYLLNWLGQIAQWREERQERRALRRAAKAWAARKKELLQTNGPQKADEPSVWIGAAGFTCIMMGIILLARFW